MTRIDNGKTPIGKASGDSLSLGRPTKTVEQRDIVGEFPPERLLIDPIGDISHLTAITKSLGINLDPSQPIKEVDVDHGIMTVSYQITDIEGVKWCLQQCASWRMNQQPSVAPVVDEVTKYLAQGGFVVPEL